MYVNYVIANFLDGINKNFWHACKWSHCIRPTKWAGNLLAPISVSILGRILQTPLLYIWKVREDIKKFWYIIYRERTFPHTLCMRCKSPSLSRLIYFYVLNFLSSSSSYAAVLTILSFSLERYLAICHPMKLSILPLTDLTRSALVITFCWIISMGASVPYYMFTR